MICPESDQVAKKTPKPNSELMKIKPHGIPICESKTRNELIKAQPHLTGDGGFPAEYHDTWSHHTEEVALISSLFLAKAVESLEVKVALVDRMMRVDIFKAHMCT